MKVDYITKTCVTILDPAIGENHRTAYINSERGRRNLIENVPEPLLSEIMAVWGDTPTVEDTPPLPDVPPSDTPDYFGFLDGLMEGFANG